MYDLPYILSVSEDNSSVLSSIINHFQTDGEFMAGEAEVSHLELGRIIALYAYARYTGDEAVEQLADTQLEELFENLSWALPLCLKNGLLGIGCGLVYLMRNHFLEGDEDNGLSKIDHTLFNTLVFLRDEKAVDWYGWLHYMRLRCMCIRPPEKQIQGIIIRQHAIYMLDCLERGMRKELVPDEDIISEVKQFHAMQICPEKTSEILRTEKRKIDFVATTDLPVEDSRVSFIIPVRIDSSERERNLDILIEELTNIKEAEIRIIEGDKQPLYTIKKPYPNVIYRFMQDADPVFHRTKYLNILLNETEGEIVGIWDTDVIIPLNQLSGAIESIRSGRAAMCFPYNGHFYMLSPEMSQLFATRKSMDDLINQQESFALAHGNHSVGGAFLVNKKIYLQAGGENENFYGWGPEDAERVKRMEILGFTVSRVQGSLFHLYHPRKENSWFGNEALELQNRNEFLNVCAMTKNELWAYIHTWKK